MRKLLLTTLLVLPLLAFAEEGDWGYSQTFFIKKSINKKWAVLSRSQFARRDDMSELFFGFADLGIGYKFLPDWRIGGSYRQVWFRPGDEWLTEHRPMINLTWFGKFDDIRITNRSRLEFREYDWDKKDDIRFRNETRVELPWGFGGLKPYFEEEFFWGKESRHVEMNWLTGGLSYKVSKQVKLKAGYRWVAFRFRSGKWENRNQLATGMNIFF